MKRPFYIMLGIVLVILSLIVPTVQTVKYIQFNQHCAGFLKQAADANTVELALERIDIAIDYIEAHNLTDGYTSVLWKTEDENINYWYRNIKACREELAANLESSSLEKSNVLMKTRETLTDNGSEGGTTLTVPTGISRYPHNLLYGILLTLSILLMCVCWIPFCYRD